MAKAIQQDTTRRAVLTGAATLALSAQAAGAGVAQKEAAISLQPTALGKALLDALPGAGKAAFLDGNMCDVRSLPEYDAAERERIDELYADAWEVVDDTVNAILDSPTPNLIDLALVAHFNTDRNECESDGEFAGRFLVEALLELAGIDADKHTIHAQYEAYGRSIGSPDWRDAIEGEEDTRRQRVRTHA